MTVNILHNLADRVHSTVAKAREELAWIERTIANEGANAMDKVRAAIHRLEGHFDGMHAAATTAKADVALANAEVHEAVVEGEAKDEKPAPSLLDAWVKTVGIGGATGLATPDPGVAVDHPQPAKLPLMPLPTEPTDAAPVPTQADPFAQPTTPPKAAEPAAPAPGAD